MPEDPPRLGRDDAGKANGRPGPRGMVGADLGRGVARRFLTGEQPRKPKKGGLKGGFTEKDLRGLRNSRRKSLERNDLEVGDTGFEPVTSAV